MPDTMRAWVSGTEPQQYVDDAFLSELGIKYWEIDVNNWQGKLDKICKERNFWNYGLKTATKEEVKLFNIANNKEHLHEGGEIQFLLDGHGYVEVRDKQERWIHVPLLSGILYVFPTGMYHRLFLQTDVASTIVLRDREMDDPNAGKMYCRESQADELPGRKEYLRRLKNSDFP